MVLFTAGCFDYQHPQEIPSTCGDEGLLDSRKRENRIFYSTVEPQQHRRFTDAEPDRSTVTAADPRPDASASCVAAAVAGRAEVDAGQTALLSRRLPLSSGQAPHDALISALALCVSAS